MVGFLHILAAFVVFMVAATLVFQWRMIKHRGVPREGFIATFADAAVPTEISAVVYDYYKKSVISKNFSVAPDDSCEHVFHKGQDDIDDDVQHLVQKLGTELPIEPVLREWEKPIETWRDMVLWLNVRQHQEVAPSKQVDSRSDCRPEYLPAAIRERVRFRQLL
jgi:hypothetical protein